jgi:hypothetical protein
MWLQEYCADALRFDLTINIRHARGGRRGDSRRLGSAAMDQ